MSFTGTSGSRSTDRQADPIFTDSSSFYGQAIPLGFGTRRVEGRPLWAGPIKGSGANRTVDFAVSLGQSGVPEDELLNVVPLRIFANGKLLVDRVSPDGWESSQSLSWFISTGGNSARPNPLIQDDLGVGNTPAFRDLIYIMFFDFPLGELDFERIPIIDVELSDVTTEIAFVQELTPLPGENSGDDANDSLNETAVDWKRKRFVAHSFRNDDTQAGTFLHVYDLVTNAEISRTIITDPNGRSAGNHPEFYPANPGRAMYLEPYNGFLICSGSSLTNIVTIDILTGVVLDEIEPRRFSVPSTIVAMPIAGTRVIDNLFVVMTLNGGLIILTVGAEGQLAKVDDVTFDGTIVGQNLLVGGDQLLR